MICSCCQHPDTDLSSQSFFLILSEAQTLICSRSRRRVAEVGVEVVRRARGEHARQLPQLAERRETRATTLSGPIQATFGSVRATGLWNFGISARVSTIPK